MRRRSRGTRYLSDGALVELRPRFGLDNEARSTSTASYDRRKPGLLSVGSPELASLAVGAGHQQDDSTTDRILASKAHNANPTEQANTDNNAERAVGGDSVKALTLDGHHAKNLAFGDRVIAGMDAGKLAGKVNGGKENSQLNTVWGGHISGDDSIGPKYVAPGYGWAKVAGKPTIKTTVQNRAVTLYGRWGH